MFKESGPCRTPYRLRRSILLRRVSPPSPRAAPPNTAAILPARPAGDPTLRADEASAQGNRGWRLVVRPYFDGGGFERYWQEAVGADGARILLQISDFACGPLTESEFRTLEALGFPDRLTERLAPITRAQIAAIAVPA